MIIAIPDMNLEFKWAIEIAIQLINNVLWSLRWCQCAQNCNVLLVFMCEELSWFLMVKVLFQHRKRWKLYKKPVKYQPKILTSAGEHRNSLYYTQMLAIFCQRNVFYSITCKFYFFYLMKERVPCNWAGQGCHII